mgnify:FL=1
MSPSSPGVQTTRTTPGSAILAHLRLIRAHACITAALGVLVGARLAVLMPPVEAIALMMLVVFCVTAAGTTLNDIADRAIDAVNRADRPIPSGAVSPRRALGIAGVLFAAGIGASLALSPWCAAFAAANGTLLAVYAVASKKLGLFKSIVVGYLVGSVFLFGAYSPDGLNVSVLVLAGCSALATVAREIVKDIEDIKGDGQLGGRTAPILLGVRTAYTLAFAALLASAALSIVPYVLGRMNVAFLVLDAAACLVFVAAAFRNSAAAIQKTIMAGSVVALLAFVVGA